MGIQNTVGLASAGMAFGPGGALLGGLLGAGLDIWGAANQAQAGRIQTANEILDLQSAVDQAGIQIKQTESDISAYESFLAAFPNYADLQKNTFEAQSRGEYKQLLENYAIGNVAAGYTGRVGGSAGMVTQENKNELVDFSGADMELGGQDGGRYEMSKKELWNNLDMEFNRATSQVDILKSSLGVLQDAKGRYETQLHNKIKYPNGKPLLSFELFSW